MKKIFTLLNILVFVVLASSNSEAQLSLQNPTTIVSGASDQLLTAYVTVVNTGSNSVYVKVARTQQTLATGHMSYFCWTECYAPSVDVSPDSILLAAGASTSVFNGDLNPLGYDGTSTVTYSFFTSAGDQVSVTFSYEVQTTGINELVTKAGLKAASPNPANAFTKISYNLNTSKDASIVICNLLGSVVKEIKLNDFQNTLTISTADFKQGVYYYSLLIDGKTVSSKKLIVSHN
jgi:hypothetical protein